MCEMRIRSLCIVAGSFEKLSDKHGGGGHAGAMVVLNARRALCPIGHVFLRSVGLLADSHLMYRLALISEPSGRTNLLPACPRRPYRRPVAAGGHRPGSPPRDRCAHADECHPSNWTGSEIFSEPLVRFGG